MALLLSNAAVISTRQQADELRDSGRASEAVPLYELLRDHYIGVRDIAKAAEVWQLAGVAEHNAGNDLEALAIYEQVLEFCDRGEADLDMRRGNIVGNIMRDKGIAYLSLAMYDLAEDHFVKSALLLDSLGEKQDAAVTRIKLAESLIERSYLPAAIPREELLAKAESNLILACDALDPDRDWFSYNTALVAHAKYYLALGETINSQEALELLCEATFVLDVYPDIPHHRRRAVILGLVLVCYSDASQRETILQVTRSAMEFHLAKLDEKTANQIRKEIHQMVSR